MPDYDIITTRGNLTFDLWVDLIDADVRPHPYPTGKNPGRTYKPETVRFTFAASTDDGPAKPAVSDLTLKHATIMGSQVKKDGTVGNQPVKEEVYRPSQQHPWLAELADEVLRTIQ